MNCAVSTFVYLCLGLAAFNAFKIATDVKPYLTTWTQEPCPCYCGRGTTKSTRYCVWYEKDDKADGGVIERRTNDETAQHPCGGARLNDNYVECFNGSCLINEVTHQTEDITDANTNSDFYYEAITFGGEVCDLGKLDIPEKDDRERLNIDSYSVSMPCDACMKSSSEVIDKIRVRIEGADGWKVAWLMVDVNHNKRTYYNGQWLDEWGTLVYDHNYH
ncbi:uncharacterized protein LOC142351959 [Convolutriloba macropyga]|uniref:uncharacterized protein LOC142351959 n=1 Tax=Convolutriloba macropyga TaxID=536237 RepID=UPI003F526A45